MHAMSHTDACMQQWHSHSFASEVELPCEARMHALFGAWSLGLGQIFTDARRLIRRLTVSGPAQLSYCSVRLLPHLLLLDTFVHACICMCICILRCPRV